MIKVREHPQRLSRLPEHEDPRGVAAMIRSMQELPEEDTPRLLWRIRSLHRHRATRPRRFLRHGLVIGMVFLMGGVVGAVVSPRLAPVLKSEVEPPSTPKTKRGKRKLKAVPKPVPERPPPEPLPTPEAIGDEPLPPPSARPHPRSRLALRSKHEPPQAPPPTAPRPAPPSPSWPSLEPELPAIPPPSAPLPLPLSSPPRPVEAIAPSSVPRLASAVPPRPVPRLAVPALPPAPEAPSPLALEQALLDRALKSLRKQRDAKAALALLAEHARRYPGSELAPEAAMLRVEALLHLGRRAHALAVLEELPLAKLPNRDERYVLRGELRAAAGRWREAQADFEVPLRNFTAPAAHARVRDARERALWGRASARSRLGDEAGARDDLRSYLRAFPSGRFAAQARALLQGSP